MKFQVARVVFQITSDARAIEVVVFSNARQHRYENLKS